MPEYTNTTDIETLNQEQMDELTKLIYDFPKKDIDWVWPKWEYYFRRNTEDLWYDDLYSKVYKRVHTDEEEVVDLKEWL